MVVEECTRTPQDELVAQSTSRHVVASLWVVRAVSVKYAHSVRIQVLALCFFFTWDTFGLIFIFLGRGVALKERLDYF